MARFIGYLQGRSRHMVSRLGDGISGMKASLNGWRAGVGIRAYADGDWDVFEVFENGGSQGHCGERSIAKVELSPGEEKARIFYGGDRYPKATELERQLFNVLQSIEAAWSRGENAQALYWAEVRKVIEAAESMS